MLALSNEGGANSSPVQFSDGGSDVLDKASPIRQASSSESSLPQLLGSYRDFVYIARACGLPITLDIGTWALDRSHIIKHHLFIDQYPAMASRLAPTNPAVGQASASRRLSGQKASVRRMAVVAHAQDGEGVMSKV